jgi:hypothetical protein
VEWRKSEERDNPDRACSSEELSRIDLCFSDTGGLLCRHYTSQKKTNVPFESHIGIVCGGRSDFVQGGYQVWKARRIEREEVRPQKCFTPLAN